MNAPYLFNFTTSGVKSFINPAEPYYYVSEGPILNSYSTGLYVAWSGHYWSGRTIADGSEEVFYHWIISQGDLPAVKVQMDPTSADGDTIDATTQLPAKTVFPGKMYHVYLNWDGTNLTLGK